jgi:hypothetical protein
MGGWLLISKMAGRSERKAVRNDMNELVSSGGGGAADSLLKNSRFVSGYAFRHTDRTALSVAPLGAAGRGRVFSEAAPFKMWARLRHA